MNKNLIQLTQKSAKILRRKYWIKQGKKCAILNKEIDYKDATLDHKHKLKKQLPGPNGRGLCRGVLHYQANSLEGVIVNKYKRFGLHKLISLPDFLRNMANYIENPTIPQKYIHHSEKPKASKLGKRDYNKIIKYYKIKYPNRKAIPYPKSGRSTIKWENILKEVNQFLKK